MPDTTYTAQKARNELYEIIRQDVSFESKAHDVLQLGVRYLGADNGHLTRINTETARWEAVVSTDPPWGRVPPGLKLELGVTYCRRTIESEGQMTLQDAQNEGWDDDPAVETLGFNWYHGTTLVLDGEPYGTICFVADEARQEAVADAELMFTELAARLLERELEREQHEAELTRQANLATVLNRILRHNLRNDLSVIRGYTQLMTDALGDDPLGDTALRNIDELIELSQKARKLEQVIDETADRQPTDLADLVDYAVDRVRRSCPDAAIEVDCEAEVAVPVSGSFERAVWELVENAAKHCGERPTITITVEVLPDTVELHVADDGPGLSEQEQAVLREGAETPLVHGSGLGLWLVYWIVDSHDGEIEATVTETGTTMTVSIPRQQRSAIEPELAEFSPARDQYRAAFEEANDAMVISDDEGRIIDANAAAATVYGLDRQALLGRPLREFLPAEFDFDTEWQQFKTDTTRRDTVVIEGDDGVDRTVEYTGVADVVPGQHLFILRDITELERRQAELKMKTQAMDKAPIGITITDPTLEDNPMVYTNDRFCELSGRGRDEILGRNCRFMQGEDTDSETVDTLRQAIDSGEAVTETLLNYRADGTTFWNRVTIAPVANDDDEIVNWVGFQRDITDRVQRKQALDESAKRLERVVNAVPSTVIAVDTEGTIQLWNDAAEELFGHTADDAVGSSVKSLKLHTDEQYAEFTDRFERALAGEQLSAFPVTRRTKDGDTVALRLSTVLLRNEASDPAGVMVVAENRDESD